MRKRKSNRKRRRKEGERRETGGEGRVKKNGGERRETSKRKPSPNTRIAQKGWRIWRVFERVNMNKSISGNELNSRPCF
jgi:hypothetical protein